MTKPFVCVLPQLGTVRFSGDEAHAFLHSQLSADVTGLAADRYTYGAYCSPKGRVLASFLLWRSPDGYFMQLPASLREPIQKQLSRFILRAKVKATDVTGELALLGVAGHGASASVEEVLGQVPQDPRGVVHTPNATVIRLPGERFEIIASQDKASRLLEALASGATKADPEYWEWLDIRAGIPSITPATQEALVPQMANLDLIGGVSFDKGCYPGQEIVARMHYRGTLKQRMYLAHVPGTEKPQPGDKLYSMEFGDQASGTIVNAARSPQGGYDALAVIQIGSARGQVRWNSSQGVVLEMLPMPYPIA